ncbi:AzlD domain-containing protein [Chitiniphilus purpureus]|uniref:AzlD domain-containing protein n=1 Tax=Chitiniphilus purpureus TaxID=2981137 RepID=A0ABY6DKW2_9NEIS|nr:AzlD domain-containing protein [Chitiniphilus sp. CD1]UXY15014.1 AzlD domain-containing protein [Chitiniphilus sp. CD1]
MNVSGEYWMILGMAAVTYIVRVSLWLGEGQGFPPLVRRVLNYVPVVVMPAIVVPSVLLPHGALWLDWRNPQLAGALVTGLIVWRWRRLLAAIVGGMLVFAAWRLAFAG